VPKVASILSSIHTRVLRDLLVAVQSPSASGANFKGIEMTGQVYERTVHVWAVPHVITVYQKSKTVWAAAGDYMGEQIEVEGSSTNVTAKWVEAARCRSR
jgi:hypothetical protein